MNTTALTVICLAALAPSAATAIVFNYSSDIVVTTAAASPAWRAFYPGFPDRVQYVHGSISMDSLPAVDLRPDSSEIGLYRTESATMTIFGTNPASGAIIEESHTGALEISIYSDANRLPAAHVGRFAMNMIGFASIAAEGPWFRTAFMNDGIGNLHAEGIGTYATLFRYGAEGIWAHGDQGGNVRLDPSSVPDGTSGLGLLAGALLVLRLFRMSTGERLTSSQA